ncbi:phiSA1p31-related protein [Streptomyces albidoflavus]
MAEQTFKVGDKVRVLAGGRGVITYGPVNSTFDTYKMFVVKQDGDGERAFKASDLAPLDRFEIGDQVVSLHFEGTRTVVAGPFRAYLGDDFYVLKSADEEHSVLHADSLRPLVLTPTTGIKVGDRVRVLRAKWVENSHGEIGTVRSVTEGFRADRDDLHPYRVEFDDESWIYAAEVEPVPATVTYDGVEYSLTAEYRDNEGDVWKFAEDQTEEGGNARMHSRGPFSERFSNATDPLCDVVDAYGPLTEI